MNATPETEWFPHSFRNQDGKPVKALDAARREHADHMRPSANSQTGSFKATTEMAELCMKAKGDVWVVGSKELDPHEMVTLPAKLEILIEIITMDGRRELVIGNKATSGGENKSIPEFLQQTCHICNGILGTEYNKIDDAMEQLAVEYNDGTDEEPKIRAMLVQQNRDVWFPVGAAANGIDRGEWAFPRAAMCNHSVKFSRLRAHGATSHGRTQKVCTILALSI